MPAIGESGSILFSMPHRPEPSAAALDSQTVKAAHAPSGGGYDAAKWTKGRKRHIAVDTDEQLLAVNLTTADVQDATGAERIVTAERGTMNSPLAVTALRFPGKVARTASGTLAHTRM